MKKTHVLLSTLLAAAFTGARLAAQDPAPAAPGQPAASPASAENPAAPKTEMQKWIETTDAQWQAAFKRDVADWQEAELNKAKVQYIAALEEGIKKVSATGDLNGALALRNEQKRFGDTQHFPEQDDAADPAAVKQIRAVIRAQLAKVNADRATRAQALHTKYDAALAQAQVQLTKAQRLDDALLVQAKRDDVKGAWLSGNPAPTAPTVVVKAPQPPVSTMSQPGVPIGARVAENMHIHASGNNGCHITVNGREIGKVMRDKPSTFTRRLHEGDVIAVKLTDRYDINSFWLSCIATTGEFLFETSEQWVSYLPKNEAKWWDIKNVEKQQPARFAPDRQEYVDLVKKSAAQTPLYEGAQPVRSEITDGSRTQWLYYVVTKADLVRKTDRKTPLK